MGESLPKYLPGNEPEKLRQLLDMFFADVRKVYPDGVIDKSLWNHERWDKAAGYLCSTLEYTSGTAFFKAYGFTFAGEKDAGAETVAVDEQPAAEDTENAAETVEEDSAAAAPCEQVQEPVLGEIESEEPVSDYSDADAIPAMDDEETAEEPTGEPEEEDFAFPEDPEALVRLGLACSSGTEGPVDRERAAECYARAAAAGDTRALCALGECFLYGEGLEKDMNNAFRCFQTVAKAGSVWAMNALGVCYYRGQGTEQNPGRALEWFLKAAKAGSSDASINLGICCCTGTGTEQSFEKGRKMFERALAQGNPAASEYLSLCDEDLQQLDS